MAWFETLYPDVHAAGGLRVALQSHLRTVVLDPPVEYPGPPPGPWTGGGATVGERMIYVGVAVHVRGFIGGFWEAGVYMGSYESTSLRETAELFERWISAGDRALRLSGGANTVVELKSWAVAHQLGSEAYVEFWWNQLFRDASDPRQFQLIRAAARVPALRGLRPFTSHWTLHFSRCTGFPFSDDCPSITPVETGLYTVSDASRTPIDTLGAEAAVLLAASYLPPGTGPAVRGPWTAEAPE